jgi:hypothetical protein
VLVGPGVGIGVMLGTSVGVFVGATVGGVVGRAVLTSGAGVGTGAVVATRGVAVAIGVCVETAGAGDEVRSLGLGSVVAPLDGLAGACAGVADAMPGIPGKSARPDPTASRLRPNAASATATPIDGPSNT